MFGAWRFDPLTVDIDSIESANPGTTTVAALPSDARLEVRVWRPGDRIRLSRPPWARRVKRYLAEARVALSERQGWPVVLADDEIVWIPGVRRSDAVPARSGRPVVLYACEHVDH